MRGPPPAGSARGEDPFEVTPTADNYFSWLRTRLAIERTLMAWIRTSTALIAFGFSVVVFFDNFARMPGVGPARVPGTALILGLTLIGFGNFALAVVFKQFRSLTRFLKARPFNTIAGIQPTPGHRPLFALVIALIVVELIAFLAILIRIA